MVIRKLLGSAPWLMDSPCFRPVWLLQCCVIVGPLLFTLGCGDGREFDTAEVYSGTEGALQATVTVGMVADLVREIGGEHVQVEQLLGSGTDPHLYRPQRDDAVKIDRADIVFYNGYLLEGKLAEQLQKTAQRKRVCAVAEGIDRSLLGGGILSESTNGHADADPHCWMDVSLWIEAAKVVRDELVAFDPKHAQSYQANYEGLASRLQSLHEYGKSVLSSIPEQQRVLITSHDAFSYFGRAYGIEVEAIQGISTESEPTVRRMVDLVDLIVERKIQSVFVESSVDQDSIEALTLGAQERGQKVEVAGSLFSDAMGPRGEYTGTYIGMMDHNVTAIAKALGSPTVPHGGFAEWLKVQAAESEAPHDSQ